jgi:hypothetical protein
MADVDQVTQHSACVHAEYLCAKSLHGVHIDALNVDRLHLGYAGLMFWLMWNRLVGSYRFLTAARLS